MQQSPYFPEPTNLTRFFLEQAGVVLEGGEMFVSEGGGNIRLNIACPQSVLATALLRIKQALVP